MQKEKKSWHFRIFQLNFVEIQLFFVKKTDVDMKNRNFRRPNTIKIYLCSKQLQKAKKSLHFRIFLLNFVEIFCFFLRKNWCEFKKSKPFSCVYDKNPFTLKTIAEGKKIVTFSNLPVKFRRNLTTFCKTVYGSTKTRNDILLNAIKMNLG